jgi:hypothetical protein
MAKANSTKQNTATIGFEAKLWLSADKLRNNMDAAEYKHVVADDGDPFEEKGDGQAHSQ